MRWSERAAVLGVLATLFAGPVPVPAQQPDTLRPPTAAQMHAQRRAWLEAQRSGALPVAPPEYGSAVVGAPPGFGAPLPGGPGAVHGGPVPVVCHGYLNAQGPVRGPVPGGATFMGDCRTYGAGGPGGPGTPGGPWLPGGPPPRESYWNGWGWTPAYPFGWGTGAGGAYQFPWPGAPADACALLYVAAAGAPGIELPVGLRSLGLADARDLDLAIEARLARGLAVDLYGLDGRWLRLEPGTLLDDVRVRPCGAY